MSLNKKKYKKIDYKKILFYDVNFSIALAGIFLALIIVLNFVFDLFKGFGGFSIQMFLVVFALGIYLIPNIVTSICFLILTPLILFLLENNIYAISPMQVFLEYFLVFYCFILMLIPRFLNKKINFNNKKRIEISLILFFYVICIMIKFFLHTIASVAYWNLNWIVSLSYNALGSLLNSTITIFFLLFALPIVLPLNSDNLKKTLNKW